MRVGIGYDIHLLKKGRKLVLGGVRIPFVKGLIGHSDGDVLLHAIVDSVLGASGEEDIGSHFSDRDPKYKNAPSSLFVKKVREILRRKRLRIHHIDSVIVAEAPRLLNFKKMIRNSVARSFGIRPEQVSVKAKTNEGIGAVGESRAIACFAVTSLGASRNRR